MRSLRRASARAALSAIVAVALPVSAVPKVVLLPPVQVAHVDLSVNLDAQGRVADLKPVTGWAPAAVTDRLAELVRPIVFTSRGEKLSEAVIRVTLATEPVAREQVALRVEHVLVARPHPVPGAAGAPTAAPPARVRPIDRPEPRFPPLLQERGVEGDVLLAIQLGPDGKVETASVVQSDLRNVRGSLNGIAGLVAQMEESALQGVRRWTYDVSASDGTPPSERDLRGILRIQFRVPKTWNDGDNPQTRAHVEETRRAGTTWLTLVRTPYHRPPWAAADQPGAIDIVDFDSSDWYPLSWFNDVQMSNDLTDMRL